MFRPGLFQVPRTTLRHWPVLTAAVTACAVIVAVFALTAPAAHRLRLPRIAGARSQLAAETLFPMAGGSPPSAPPPVDDTVPKAHVAQTTAQPVSYTDRKGDTLSVIARRVYGHANRWPALWWVNRHKVKNPAALAAGTRLRLSAWHPDKVWLTRKAVGAIPKPPPRRVSHPGTGGGAVAAAAQPAPAQPAAPSGGGVYSYSQLEALWVSAGGPPGAAAEMATIAECESGGNPRAYNPSGASGLWQILGNPFPGDPFDPATNARMAVAKYNAAGGTSPWVCAG